MKTELSSYIFHQILIINIFQQIQNNYMQQNVNSTDAFISKRFSYKATLKVWNGLSNLFHVDNSSKAPSTTSSIERFHRRNLSLLKDLVQAPVSSMAHKWVTLIHQSSVDTVRLRTAWCFVICSAIALWNLIQLGTMSLNISYWHIHLHTAARSGSHLSKIILIVLTSNPVVVVVE